MTKEAILARATELTDHPIGVDDVITAAIMLHDDEMLDMEEGVVDEMLDGADVDYWALCS